MPTTLGALNTTQQNKKVRAFVISAGILLLFTAIAKFISAAGDSQILHRPDPILNVNFQSLFIAAGIVECVVAVICLLKMSAKLQVVLLVWLTSNFCLYRIGAMSVSFHPCPCLGSLTNMLHISTKVADSIMWVVFIYLLVGSYAALFWLRLQKRLALSKASQFPTVAI